ncbi:MAG: hypothetical protein AAFV95_06110 [Bacteroidota bacterium]
MKTTIQLIFLLSLVQLLACTEQAPEKETAPPMVPMDIYKNKQAQQDSTAKLDKEPVQKYYEYRYVSANSGLIYRAAPKGKPLGKFPLNTQVKLLEKTGVVEKIQDGGKTVEGEWVGVENGSDTVYVFSGFLATYFTYSPLGIYYAGRYYKTENEEIPGYINLSENYPVDYESDSPSLLSAEDLGKQMVEFTPGQKRKFLKAMRLMDRDTAFLYNLFTDSIYKFVLRDVSAIAVVNAYADGENLKEYDYEMGLSLGKAYQDQGETFAYIGRDNPFQQGKAEPILWTKVDDKDFSFDSFDSSVREKMTDWLAKPKEMDVFTYSNNSHDYYLQNSGPKDEMGNYHLLVANSKTGALVFEEVFFNSESTYPLSLNTTGKKKPQSGQWTGTIFKGQSPIIYGFMGNSFGCPLIQFLSEREAPILIRCDNRH